MSTSAVVFLGFRVSRKPATQRYPCGYERAEDLAGLEVAAVIWLSAVFAGVESYRKPVSHGGTGHLGYGMVGAVLGVPGNQLVARYKARIGRRLHSATLLADTKHSWLDALSSVGALAGLIAVAAGYRWGDPVAGVAVTLFIVHVGYEVTVEISQHLLDGVAPEHLRAARDADGTGLHAAYGTLVQPEDGTAACRHPTAGKRCPLHAELCQQLAQLDRSADLTIGQTPSYTGRALGVDRSTGQLGVRNGQVGQPRQHAPGHGRLEQRPTRGHRADGGLGPLVEMRQSGCSP